MELARELAIVGVLGAAAIRGALYYNNPLYSAAPGLRERTTQAFNAEDGMMFADTKKEHVRYEKALNDLLNDPKAEELFKEVSRHRFFSGISNLSVVASLVLLALAYSGRRRNS